MIAEQEAARSRDRRAMVGTGDRSAKIRTYNFPQSRVTDHRINLSVHNLADVIDGRPRRAGGCAAHGEPAGAGWCLTSLPSRRALLAEATADARRRPGVSEPRREALRLWSELRGDARRRRSSSDGEAEAEPEAAAALRERRPPARRGRAAGPCGRPHRLPAPACSAATAARSFRVRRPRGWWTCCSRGCGPGRVADIGTGSGCLALSLATEGAFEPGRRRWTSPPRRSALAEENRAALGRPGGAGARRSLRAAPPRLARRGGLESPLSYRRGVRGARPVGEAAGSRRRRW